MTDAALRRARLGVFATFTLMGFLAGSYAGRIPSIRDRFDLDPGQLGLVLLCLSIGSLCALPLTGGFVLRFGTIRTAGAGALVSATGLAAVGCTGLARSIPLLVIGLLVIGLGMGSCDAAMNIAGTDVERALGRSIMPRFHAFWSLGTVLGALVTAGANVAGLSLFTHLVPVAVVVAVGSVVATSGFLPAEPGARAESGGSSRRRALAAWRERRTLLVGAFVLILALTEGVANDWLSLSLVDGYHAAHAIGSLGLGVFLAAMTLGRTVGTAAIDRAGRVPMMRATIVLAVAGITGVAFGPVLGVAFAGAAAWGLGASLGFPGGMSAAADDPAHAAVRVSVVASIGYTAFLAGPPLIGFLADSFGLRHALLAVVGALVIAMTLAPVLTRPVTAEPAGTDGEMNHDREPGEQARPSPR